MNDSRAVELLELSKKYQACSLRLAPYQKKMEQGSLQMSDLTPDDAVWILGVVRTPVHREILKQIAKGHPALKLIKD
jgi:hypothetical protein